MKLWFAAAGAAFLCIAASAQAEDTDPCGRGMVCASAPQTVVDAMDQADLMPVLSVDDAGDPMISAESGSWSFHVFFYGCEANKNCDSLQFLMTFADDGANTADLANRWNSKKRFSQLSVDEDSELNFRYDVSTLGGLTEKNFADVLDWWDVMLGDLSVFFEENAA